MKRTLLAAALAAATGLAQASVITLTFEGAGDQAYLQNFYNGGTDSAGHSGTNYGIGFGNNAMALIDADAGGNGNFANEPTPNTVMFFLSGSAVLNYAPGFTDGFSFYYTTMYSAAVRVYDGLDGTGNLLGTINLSSNYNSNCTGDPSGSYCHWDIGSLGFTGTAKSIDFGGTANYVAYDNITFGSTVPSVPEPETYAMMMAGLGLLAGAARRRRKSQTA